MPPSRRSPPKLPASVATILAGLPLLAGAVEFAPLLLRSSIGEPLLAEVGVRAEDGERLSSTCFRAYAPPGSAGLATGDLHLRFEGDPSAGRLIASGTLPLAEPAAVLGIEAQCGRGRTWREMPLFAMPRDSGPRDARSAALRVAEDGAWIVVAGESPASLARVLYPDDANARRRLIAALADANPGLEIAGNATLPLPAGTRLRMPDWRALGQAPTEGASARRAAMPTRDARPRPPVLDAVDWPRPSLPVAVETALPSAFAGLKLATVLAPAPVVDEATRQVLRQEYRLLGFLAEHLSEIGSGVTAVSAGTALVTADASPPLRLSPATAETASLPAPAASAGPSPVPVLAPAQPAVPAEPTPVRLRNVVDAAPAKPESTNASLDWLPLAAGGAALLGAVFLWLRRRTPATPAETPLEYAETLVMAPQPPSNGAARAPSAVDVAPASAPAPMAPPLPLPEIPADAGTVLELAEIMRSFGRPEEAEKTLLEYIESHPGDVVQPRLKLLDIYRDAGRRDAFEMHARRLREEQGVASPQWDAREPSLAGEPQSAAALEALPQVCGQIVARWNDRDCLSFLRQLLRDNRGSDEGGLPLPVVQELLLLIDILSVREPGTDR